MSSAAFVASLRRQAPEFNLELSAEILERFARHYELLVTWNRKINLTRIVEPEAAARRHFLESAYLTTIISNAPKQVVDVGSGAGFPGMPLACIWSTVPVRLVEPLVKRAVFLKEVARSLGLAHVSVSNERFTGKEVDEASLLVARALDRFDEMLGDLLDSRARCVALFSDAELLRHAEERAPGRVASVFRLPASERRLVGLFER